MAVSVLALSPVGWARDVLVAKPGRPTAAVSLKRHARHISAISLLDESNRVVGTMEPALLAATKKAIAKASVSDGMALTPAPWPVLLEVTLENGDKLYARLIRDQILRVGRSPNPAEYSNGPFRPYVELVLDFDDGISLWYWLQGILGPTKVKSYQLPEGLVPRHLNQP